MGLELGGRNWRFSAGVLCRNAHALRRQSPTKRLITWYLYDTIISLFSLEVRWSNAPARRCIASHGKALSIAGNFGFELRKAVALPLLSVNFKRMFTSFFLHFVIHIP